MGTARRATYSGGWTLFQTLRLREPLDSIFACADDGLCKEQAVSCRLPRLIIALALLSLKTDLATPSPKRDCDKRGSKSLLVA